MCLLMARYGLSKFSPWDSRAESIAVWALLKIDAVWQCLEKPCDSLINCWNKSVQLVSGTKVISHSPSQVPRIKRNRIQIRLDEPLYQAPKGFKICHCSKDLSCKEKMETGIFIYKYENDKTSQMVLAHKQAKTEYYFIKP